MAASEYNFLIEQGTSFKLSVIYKDANGNPVDLTNWCARLVWRTNDNIQQTFLTTNLDYTTYKFIIEPLIGKVTLWIPPETTNNFGSNSAKYDLELQSDDEIYLGGGKNIVRLLYGNITFIQRFSKYPGVLECDI